MVHVEILSSAVRFTDFVKSLVTVLRNDLEMICGIRITFPEGRAAVVGAIESLTRALKSAPTKLDHKTLNLLGFEGGEFNGDIERERLLEIAQAFLDLIAGKIQCDASSTEFMPGCWVAT